MADNKNIELPFPDGTGDLPLDIADAQIKEYEKQLSAFEAEYKSLAERLQNLQQATLTARTAIQALTRFKETYKQFPK